MTRPERALLLATVDALVAHLRNPMSPDAVVDAIQNLGRIKAQVVEAIASGGVRELYAGADVTLTAEQILQKDMAIIPKLRARIAELSARQRVVGEYHVRNHSVPFVGDDNKYRAALVHIIGDVPEPMSDPWQMCREIAAEALGTKAGTPPVPYNQKRMPGGHIEIVRWS